MRKAKRALIIIMSLMLVLSIAMITASAATGSASGSYTSGAYSGYCTLTLTDHSTTATMSAAITGFGVVLPDPIFKLEGTMVAFGGDKVSLFASGIIPSTGSLTIKDTRSITTDTTTSVECDYKIGGSTVKTLFVE